MTINNSAAGILKFAATLVGNALLVCWLFFKRIHGENVHKRKIYPLLSKQTISKGKPSNSMDT